MSNVNDGAAGAGESRRDAGIRERMLAGGLWVAVTQAAVQGGQFVITAVLAHLLFPADYGLFGMCAVVVSLSYFVNELGLWSAVVQAKTLTREAETSSFWLCAAMGLAMCGVVYLAAPAFGRLFGEARIVPLLRALTATLPINAAATIPTALLARRLDFKRQGFAEIARTAGYGAVGIPLALAGAGPWSLVAGEVAAVTARAVAAFALARWRPAAAFAPSSLKRLLAFGLNVTGAGLSLAARDNADKFIVGRLLGAGVLGGYGLAYRLITAPQKRVSNMVERVTFAGFSAMQDDRKRMRAIYCRVVRLTALISFPALAWLAASAGPFVAVVFGARWLFIVPSLRVLCVAGAFYAVFSPVRSLILGTGRAGWEFALLFLSLVLLTAAVFIGTRFGMFGVATAFSVQAGLSYAAYQAVGHRAVGVRFRTVVRFLLGPLALAAAVGVAAGAAASATAAYGAPAALACSASAGAVVYGAALKLFSFAEVRQVAGYVGERLGAFPGASALARFAFNGRK